MHFDNNRKFLLKSKINTTMQCIVFIMFLDHIVRFIDLMSLLYLNLV